MSFLVWAVGVVVRLKLRGHRSSAIMSANVGDAYLSLTMRHELFFHGHVPWVTGQIRTRRNLQRVPVADGRSFEPSKRAVAHHLQTPAVAVEPEPSICRHATKAPSHGNT